MVDGQVSRELLTACRRGDPRALEELVRRTHRRVYALAHRLVGDPHEAEDVTQEAYLRMFRGLAGFREEARFETWMHRIVTNTAFNQLRRRGRFGEVLQDEVLDVPGPDTAAPVATEREELERALARLPVGQRTVLVLKDVYGLSCREIGEELGIEEGAVKVRLHRARKRLRGELAGPPGGGGQDDV
ncbi:MAG TPA: sigma-70 family RNA polymerase sigma factor [Actinomycetota bacterium]|nr:sigma-70 family RNA polymerase sigma factor [Actinomycetota bacterium]